MSRIFTKFNLFVENLYKESFFNDLPQPYLVILIGPPLAGKSTFLEQNKNDAKVISFDNILMELNPKLDYNAAYKEADHEEIFNILNQRFRTAQKDNSNIIIDMTNISINSRKKWIENISSNYYIIGVIFPIDDIEKLEKRNTIRKETGKNISTEVLKNMLSGFTYPTPDEGFDRLYHYEDNEIQLIYKDDKSKIINREERETSIEDMLTDKRIAVKELGNGIVSLNFTKETFWDKAWDSQTIKARGLFYDKEEQKIIARGFEKFFNINERESFEDTLKKFQYPINVWHKYNGFLGIISYNHKTNELFICSKSTDKGEFADLFKILLNKYNMNYLTQYLKDNNVSLVFEVIDIENDPHIITYNESHLVLLDIIENQLEFKTKPFKELQTVAKKLNLTCKEIVKIINNQEELLAFYDEILADDYSLNGEYIEGFVFEDKAGFMIKFKTGFYNYWKLLRGICDKVNKVKTIAKSNLLAEKFLKMPFEKIENLSNEYRDIINNKKKVQKGKLTHEDKYFEKEGKKLAIYYASLKDLSDKISERGRKFFNFLLKKDSLDKDIISLRNEFLKT